MQTLRDAVLTAARFATPHKGKDQLSVSGVRLLPRTEQFPARVLAMSQMAAILIDVEGDLPNLVVDAAGIQAAARAEPHAEVRFDGDLVAIGRYRFKPWCKVEQYPGIPPIPGPEFFQVLPDSTPITLVIHAAGSDPGRPELDYVSFRPGFVEATDGVRLARTPLQVNRTAQIHPDVFDGWPGGMCEFTVEDSAGAVFRWPGEVRWGKVYRGNATRPYPDLGLVEDDRVDQIEVVAPVDSFRQVVRKVTSVSPVKAVKCRFRRGTIEVAAVLDAKEARIAGYEDKVPALCRGEADIVVSGTALLGALTTVDTPRVMLGLGGEYDAMVVRAGTYVEHIYPIRF